MGQMMNQHMDIDGQTYGCKEKWDTNFVASTSEMDYENFSSNEKEKIPIHKISSQDVQKFCHQLEVFVADAQMFRKKIGGYPMALQERLNNDIRNLEFLFIETQETVRNIQKIKTQHKYIKKDYANTEKLLKKLKEEEVQEIENQVSKCDTNTYKIWETLKRSAHIDNFEKFSIELEEKVSALERLKGLVIEKLTEMQETPQALVKFHSPAVKPKEKSVKILTYEARKLTRSIRSGKKRKQPEQNDVIVTIQDKAPPSPPQLPPLPMNPFASILNDTDISSSMSESTGIMLSSQSLTNTIASGAYRTESLMRDDMQSVFDALFGNLKQENDSRYEDGIQDRQANFTNSSINFDFFDQDLSYLQ